MSLRDFFTTLASDQMKLDAYKADPATAMTESGVSADDQALVMSGDLAAIKNEVESEPGSEAIIIIVVVKA